MPKRKKKPIPPQQIPSRNIPQPSFDDYPIKFSFKHLDLRHPTFNTANCDKNYLNKFLERLRSISELKRSDLISPRNPNSLRCHKINWEDTSVKKGFNHLNFQLQSIPAFQFEITKRKYGRVHGFFLNKFFFVVWLDPYHMLYP